MVVMVVFMVCGGGGNFGNLSGVNFISYWMMDLF